MKWLPWRYVIRRVAHKQGFLDPVALLARLPSFAQPSEVGEPLERLRAGAVFHARGRINSRVIQHNLDGVWPYWIERQFDPYDESFIPRAADDFSAAADRSLAGCAQRLDHPPWPDPICRATCRTNFTCATLIKQ